MRMRRLVLAAIITGALLTMGLHQHLSAQSDDAGFPDGFDAVQAAPASHHVIFENSLVRVLQVTLPPPGSAEPMHFHRWPSLFLGYDTGGKTAHIRYRTPRGKVRDIPSETAATHSGVWSADWMKPEPMHSIEVVSAEVPGPGSFPGWLRVEIKVSPRDGLVR